MEDLGFKKDFILKSLLNNDINYATTAYFLLLNRFELYLGIKHNLSDKTVNELKNIKRVNSFITNVALFIGAGYMLKIIFAI